MDRFDLRWPSAEATFFTDGWRCRIVWRQTSGKHTAGGMGGTIENNAQCKQRVAASLDGAPYLISALKARGHDRLANEIEQMADGRPGARAVQQPQAAAPQSRQRPAARPGSARSGSARSGSRREAGRAGPKRAESKPIVTPESNRVAAGQAGQVGGAAEAAPIAAEAPRSAHQSTGQTPLAAWLAALPGTRAFEEVATRRAKQWLEVGELGAEAWSLRVPAPRGKPEWVLRRSWPAAKRKAEYVAAPHLKGILAYMLKVGANAAQIETLLTGCREVEHEEVAAAATGWRAAMGKTH